MRGSWQPRFAGLAAAAVLSAGPAAAHGTERGFVLLLPTGYYLAGGALAVAATFLLLAAAPAHLVRRTAGAELRLGTLPAVSPVPTSLASFLSLALLILAGFYGSRDPLANPLPLTIWTLWWVGLTLLHAALGNLWSFLNPWTGPYRLLTRLAGTDAPPLAYPARLGYWPAILFFFGFAWLELVYPAPDDPGRLAVAAVLYWLVAFAGLVLFGERDWLMRAEPFAIFFRLVAGLSPLRIGPPDNTKRRGLALVPPGSQLLRREPLPLSGVIFVLLTLGSVSFDGLSKTFWWLGLGDINPLEFPGRSAVVGRNTIGLLLTFAVLCIGYFGAIRLGWRLVGRPQPSRQALGAFIYSIVPISIVFHFSHYLTALLVDGQYAIAALSDPFASGLDLFGLGHVHVTASYLNTYGGVRAIWNLQTAGIVIGHVVAIALAHALALRHFGERSSATASQTPLAALMVLYTLFGLWLLSTPVFG